MATSNGKPLRFAALIRVSTETQEKKSESLNVQKKRLKDDVAKFPRGSKIVEWYGGQEHATPGWEKHEVDRLLRDASKDIYDAVIIAFQDRWSRDNAKSKEGIKVFRHHGKRFFVGSFEYDLNNATQRFQIAMAAEIGELNAATQNQRAVESKIARAKRGLPVCGKLPTARLFNKKTEKWSIDRDKHAMIKDCARRYLDGESMRDLAAEYGVNSANLHRTLMERCGDTWIQRFWDEVTKEHIDIPTPVGRLLPEKTIEAMRRKAKFNQTFVAKQNSDYFKYKYLLSGFIFCEDCGYKLTGANPHADRPNGGKRYYRHAHGPRVKKCKICKCHIQADRIEGHVIEELFTTFGNPKAVERAIFDAIPNQEQIAELREQQGRIQKALDKTAASKKRVLDTYADGLISKSEFTSKRAELDEQESKHKDKLRKIEAQLENVPDKGYIEHVSTELVEQLKKSLRVRKSFRERMVPQLLETKDGRLDASLHMKVTQPDERLDLMTWDDKRALIERLFDGVTPDGEKAGIYIRWSKRDNGSVRWGFAIRGIIPLVSPDSAGVVESAYA